MRKIKLFFCGRLFPFALLSALLLIAGIFLCVRLPRLLAPAAAAERIFALTAAVVLFCDPSPAEYKLSKLFLVLLLPWTGAIACFCFLFRENKFRGGMTGIKRRKREFGGTMSESSPDKISPLSGLQECRAGRVEYFPVGRAMYERFLGDLKRAKESIWLEFYIVAEGSFLGDVMEILTERAEAGVDVRLLFDGFGSALTLSPSFPAEAERRGIKVCIFRPLKFPTRAAGRRDHRKIAVIDGKIGYTGGINLADEYIGEVIRFGHWKDMALRVTGGAASALSALFARSWNAEERDRPVRAAEGTGGKIPCAVISDDTAETSLRAGQQTFLRLFGLARKRLYVTTPYLAPDLPLCKALGCAALAGVDVRVMIPHIPDKKFPFLLTRSYAAELQASGVGVREYTDGFLHGKTVVSDDISFVSSYNLDFRSLYLQAECGVAVKQRALADRIADDFLSAWESGTPLPVRGKAAEFFCRLLRLAAPLL